ncbi:tetraspanin-7-like [Copidosoma floridanum]|uniref:tetraspanin-7-like n=1 Tax=Copidosoma floridanum TaxID=29053 RepID=UPI0006C953C2|nr:tetraspanin-7-like [Copidosoma floridanum]
MAKKLETVAAMACMTVFLMLFNLVFICSGLAMLCVGIYMRMELQSYANLGIESSGAALLALSSLGALVTLVGVLACCCTTRQHPALLYLYGAFLAMVALLELAAGASMYSYRTSLIEGFDRGLNETLAAYGTDKSKNLHVDTMQSTLHCCGNRAYTDWLNMSPPKAVPSSCCSVQPGECDTNSAEDLYTEGCYSRVMNFARDNVGLVAGGALGLAVFPMAGVFLACCLASYINKVNYEQIA